MLRRRSKLQRKIIAIFLLLFLLSVESLASLAEDVTVNPNSLSGGLIKSDGYYLPRGLNIPVELRTPIDTRVSKRGDQVTAQVMEDILINDYVIVPTNTFLHGYISKFEKPGKLFKRPKLEIEFDRLTLRRDGEMKELTIKGLVKQKELISKSSIVNFGTPFRTKAIAAGATGAVATGSVGYAFVALVEPYDTFGIATSLDVLTVGALGIGGALAGAALIKRDDVRMEPGTKLNVLLAEATYDYFSPKHTLSRKGLEDGKPSLSLSEEYERLSTMRSEELADVPEKTKK